MNIKTLAAATLAAFALVPAAAAQDYPDRPITMVLPFAPGGPTDLVGRLFSDKLQVTLDQSIVLENRPGAGGTVAAVHVSRAPADGYTLFYASISALAMAPGLYPDLQYDPLDFVPVGQVAEVPLILLVSPDLPVDTVEEFIAYARENPGMLNYGSAGNGTPSHLGTVRLNQLTGIEGVHVPYSSGGEALTGLLQGELQYLLDTTFSAASHIEAGTVKLLASAGAERSEFFPDIPTLTEAAVPGFTISTWNGIVAPAGTPEDVIAVLEEAVQTTMSDPELLETMRGYDTRPVGSSAEEFGAFIESELGQWQETITDLGASVQ